ncbi:hypothetical protein FCULG_00005026 [Fusarium culmorum]|uniref:Uncharacterized protein n=1 Tax=Fusarium culmorum TaxID=5516 RepID=A0A2T4H9K2_FUSCU|nr:hypothetical protein FCULG_00005026 [Fusarium culmorum]
MNTITMHSSCVLVTCTSSSGMFRHHERQANCPDDVLYSMGISTWTEVHEGKKAILALRLASEPPRFRVVVGSCSVITANFFRGFGPDLSNIVMVSRDCFFHLVEWIEYDETEPNWELVWKVESVCPVAMIDFADDDKQTCSGLYPTCFNSIRSHIISRLLTANDLIFAGCQTAFLRHFQPLSVQSISSWTTVLCFPPL